MTTHTESTHGDEVTATLALVTRRCPRFRPAEVLAVTAKSVLLAGRLDGQAVVAKRLTSSEPAWRDRFANELTTYERFAGTPPPIRVPQLHLTDPEAGLLIVERIHGAPLATDRHPGPLPCARIAAALATLTALARWRPDPPLPPRLDYRDRLARYTASGLLDEAEAATLAALLDARTWDLQPGHGDPLPANLLFDHTGAVTLIDWEYAGAYLPGYDLALLWTLLDHNPRVRNAIASTVRQEGPAAWNPFLVNAALLVARETRMHRELPGGVLRTESLRVLARDRAALAAATQAAHAGA